MQHVPLLRVLEAEHRRESRMAAMEHPQTKITNAQMDTLTSSVYAGEITLDTNRYRIAYQAAKSRLSQAEDLRAVALRSTPRM